MPFGIKPANKIFQRRLEQILEGIPGVNNIHNAVSSMEKEKRGQKQSIMMMRGCRELKCGDVNTSEEKLIVKAK